MYEIQDTKEYLAIKYTKNGKTRFAVNSRTKGMESMQTTKILLPSLIKEMENDQRITN